MARNYQQNKNATARRKNPKIAALATSTPQHAYFSASASQAVVINYAAQKRRHNVNKHLTSNLQLVWWPKCSRSVTASGSHFPPLSLALSHFHSISSCFADSWETGKIRLLVQRAQHPLGDSLGFHTPSNSDHKATLWLCRRVFPEPRITG